MSNKLVVDIWHSPYGDASTILVLMALADEANDKGEYSAEITTLAHKSRQSVRNCRYILKKLEDLDVIERFVNRGRGHKNSYRIHVENLQNLQPLPILEQEKPQRAQKQTTSEENLQPLPISENLQMVQPLPILGDTENLQKVQMVQPLPILKPANAATIAGNLVPSPLDPLTLDKTKEKDKEHTLPPTPLTGQEQRESVSESGNSCQRCDDAYVDTTTVYSQGFQHILAAYPADRREGEMEAWRVWSMQGLEPRWTEIAGKIEGLKRVTWRERERRYIPLIKTWFEKGRYNDAAVVEVVTEDEAKERLGTAGYQTMKNMQRVMEERDRGNGHTPRARLLPRPGTHE